MSSSIVMVLFSGTVGKFVLVGVFLVVLDLDALVAVVLVCCLIVGFIKGYHFTSLSGSALLTLDM